jgi:hypothetical protein
MEEMRVHFGGGEWWISYGDREFDAKVGEYVGYGIAGDSVVEVGKRALGRCGDSGYVDRMIRALEEGQMVSCVGF